MTLRDYLAAAALPGLLMGLENYQPALIAECAYGLADAMLAQRAVAEPAAGEQQKGT